MIAIEGEAGIGKSALVADAGRLAEQLNMGLIVAVADAVERTTGYYAWRQAFAGILGVEGEHPTALELERRVVALIGADADVSREIPLLAGVLPVEIPDNDFTGALSGDLRADVTIRLLTRILSCAAAARPVVIVVEDAQWLDTNSWSLLRAVASDVSQALTLVTTRALSSEAEGYGTLRALSASGPLQLGSLSPADTAELVRRRLGVTESSPGLARFVTAERRRCVARTSVAGSPPESC